MTLSIRCIHLERALYKCSIPFLLKTQAMARVWRDGQRRRTYIYRLISTGTIEEKMYQRQINKQGLSGVVVDAKASDSKQNFSPEQLRELFQAPDGSLCSTHDLLNCDCQGGDDVAAKPAEAPLPSTVRTCQLLTSKLSQASLHCMKKMHNR